MTNTALRYANPIGRRLRTEMKKRGVTSAELAKRADVKTSFLYDVISGKSANPSTVKLARVAESLGISLAELAGGKAATSIAPAKKTFGEYISIPRLMVDSSAGANMIVAVEQEGEAYSFRTKWIREHLGARPEDLRMLAMRGDSMEPTLGHNDAILVDTGKKQPTPPGIFVLFDGLGLVARRLEYIAHQKLPRIRVSSDNPQYSTYDRSPDEIAIIGRVVWFARET